MVDVIVFIPRTKGRDLEEKSYELSSLLKCLHMRGSEMRFNVRNPNNNTYLSRVIIENIKSFIEISKELGVEYKAIVIDDNLSGIQSHNLSKELGIEVIDKTNLILSIFEVRASSYEARLQVQIAKLQYQSTQLVHSDADYAQVTSGKGKNKGKGETEKELEKRRIKRSIHEKKMELEKIKKVRKTGRNQRKSSLIPTVALVGYTNAGKSSLMNLLLNKSKAQSQKLVLVEDRLFATLDTSTRLIDFYNYPSFLLSDTVGFLNDLPHFLLSAFKSTLEEISEADLIIEVVDISYGNYRKKMTTTNDVLKELGCDKIKRLTFYNKYDVKEIGLDRLLKKNELYTVLSGESNNADEVINFISDWLTKKWKKYNFFIPYEDNCFEFYKNTYIIKKIDKENGQLFTARINPNAFDKFAKYLVTDS